MKVTSEDLALARATLRAAEASEAAAKASADSATDAGRLEADNALAEALAAIPARSKGAPARREAAHLAHAEALARLPGRGALAEVRKAREAAANALADLIIEAMDENDVSALAAARDTIRYQEIAIGYGPASVEVQHREDRDRYSKTWHRQHGPAKSTRTIVIIPPEWADRVYAQGLAAVDGLLTLDAVPVEAPPGYEAWAAAWVEQGRGYSAELRRGVIIRTLGRDPQATHAPMAAPVAVAVAAGVRALARRARAAWLAAKASAVDLELHRATRVTFGDSRAVGNCATGTRQWAARAGLDVEAGATVGQILDALAAGAGLDSLAIAACRRAVARSLPANTENFATAT